MKYEFKPSGGLEPSTRLKRPGMCAGERTQRVASRLSGAQPEERRSPSPIPPPRGCGEGVKHGCLVSAGCGSKCSLTHTATFGTRSAGASDL